MSVKHNILKQLISCDNTVKLSVVSSIIHSSNPNLSIVQESDTSFKVVSKSGQVKKLSYFTVIAEPEKTDKYIKRHFK